MKLDIIMTKPVNQSSKWPNPLKRPENSGPISVRASGEDSGLIMIPTLEQLRTRVSDPFFTQTDFGTLNKKYVDFDNPSASDANPGTSALPYKTLTPVTNITAGTAVIITPSIAAYAVPVGGLSLIGAEGAPSVIISSDILHYPILDAMPYTFSGHFPPDSESDIRVRQIIDVSGQYCRVENLKLRYGFRHNIVLRGRHSVTKNNILIGANEDSIKVANTVEDIHGADYGLIYGNDVSGYASQGIDFFGANNWLIDSNIFHDTIVDPITGVNVAGGIGLKGGASNVIVAVNHTTNMIGGGIILGGAGTNFNVPTVDCVATNNTIDGTGFPGITLPSTLRGQVYRNIIASAIGLRIGIDPDIRLTLPDTPTCKNTTVAGNNFTLTNPAGVHFEIAAFDDTYGLISGNNVYNVYNRFKRFTQILNHTQFVSLLGTDFTSRVV